MLRTQAIILLTLAAALQGLAACCAADEEPAEPFTPSAEFQDWMCGLVRAELPDHYEKKKNWGHQARALDGLSIQFDDGRLKTHRKYKQANDGSWQMYRVDLVDPEEKFDIRVANLRTLEDGRVGMQITAVASVKASGRQALWEKGVQIYSISAEADARVRLTAETAVATQLDPTKLPPDVYLKPEVTAAKVEILEFKLRRISDLDGPLIRTEPDGTAGARREAGRGQQEVVAKLNKAIDKQEKKLKLSAADLVKFNWDRLERRHPLQPPQDLVQPANDGLDRSHIAAVNVEPGRPIHRRNDLAGFIE